MIHIRVSIWPIRRDGSWGYLAGSRSEATPCFMFVLKIVIKLKLIVVDPIVSKRSNTI